MIFMSLEVQIEGLQKNSKHQKQRNKEENMEEEEDICYILSQFF